MAKVMIMAGGTGGHVFPGIAVSEALKAQNIEVCWLGTQGGMEQNWVERAHIPFEAITIQGLRGKGLLGWLKSPFQIARAFWQARRIIRQQAPDLVLGMGGFVCGPGGLAAKWLKKTLVLHEQNAIPGLTNRLLAPLASHIFVAFPQQKLKGAKVEVVGNPVRPSLKEVPPVQAHQPCHLLVVGGSRGALIFNEVVPQALAMLPLNQRPIVKHQTGALTFKTALENYQNDQVEAEVMPFIEQMEKAYEWADLVLCRAGALTVSELMAVARPAVLVPFPYAVDDHQTANAKILEAIGGGEILPQSDLTAETLKDRLLTCCQKNHLLTYAKALQAKKAEAVQATEKMVQRLLQML